jgi:hypothetical protein
MRALNQLQSRAAKFANHSNESEWGMLAQYVPFTGSIQWQTGLGSNGGQTVIYMLLEWLLVGRLAVANRTDVGKTLEPAFCRRTCLFPCKLKALRKTEGISYKQRGYNYGPYENK